MGNPSPSTVGFSAPLRLIAGWLTPMASSAVHTALQAPTLFATAPTIPGLALCILSQPRLMRLRPLQLLPSEVARLDECSVGYLASANDVALKSSGGSDGTYPGATVVLSYRGAGATTDLYPSSSHEDLGGQARVQIHRGGVLDRINEQVRLVRVRGGVGVW